MVPLKRILCPIDFSETSLEALKTANELALHFSATVYLLHVVPPLPPLATPMAGLPEGWAEMSPHAEKYREELVKASEDALHEATLGRPGELVGLYPLVMEGAVPETILKTAAEKEADLIVMGTHGLTGWRRLIFGSVTERVLRSAPCPVLAVPPPTRAAD